MTERDRIEAEPISLAERRASTPRFRSIYEEGMSLVEEAAEYLDGLGRREAKSLTREEAALYAAESMRLTTRLMQIASWLLLQRASNSGEMTRDQVFSEKAKVRLDTSSAREDAPLYQALPECFRSLVERSLSLQSRVRHLDEDLYRPAKAEAVRAQDNPVSEQIMLLKTAFGRG